MVAVGVVGVVRDEADAVVVDARRLEVLDGADGVDVAVEQPGDGACHDALLGGWLVSAKVRRGYWAETAPLKSTETVTGLPSFLAGPVHRPSGVLVRAPTSV